MLDILILTIVFTLISSCALSWFLAVNKVRLDRDKFNLDKYDLNINTDIKMGQLDEFLESIMNEYIATHISPNEYIDNPSMKLIMRDCVSIIEKRMTQALKDQMSVFYNESELNDIIVNKVFIYISSFVKEKNANTLI